jgi:nucleoid-associated protein YejK
MATLSTKNFSFDSRNREFEASASEVGLQNTPVDFHMKSAETGKVVTFNFARYEYSSDGEILMSIYRSKKTDSLAVIHHQ